MTDSDIPPHVRRVLDSATSAIRDVRKLAERLADRQDELSGFIITFRVHVDNLQKAVADMTTTMTGDHVNPGYTTKLHLLTREILDLKDAVEALNKARKEEATTNRQGAWTVLTAVIAAIAAIVGAIISVAGGG